MTIAIDRGPVTTLWLDRADKRNALDGATMKALAVALDEVAGDRAVRVVVIRGKGPVFSSGIDHALLLEVMAQSKTQPFLHLHHQLQETFDRMARLAQPVVVACHGVCVGMALELALAADIRIATSDCVLGLPEIAFGIVPDVGGTTRLVRAAGEVRARELILTGRLFKAAAAERYGVVHEVVEPADLHRVVTERAEALAAHPAAALEHAKALCQASGDASTAASLRLEGVVQQGLIASPELAAQFPKALAFIKAQLAAAR